MWSLGRKRRGCRARIETELGIEREGKGKSKGVLTWMTIFNIHGILIMVYEMGLRL